jgi:hypothetical protein
MAYEVDLVLSDSELSKIKTALLFFVQDFDSPLECEDRSFYVSLIEKINFFQKKFKKA